MFSPALLPAWPLGSRSGLPEERKHPRLSLGMAGFQWAGFPLQWCAARGNTTKLGHTNLCRGKFNSAPHCPDPTRHDWFPTRRFCFKSYFSPCLSADSEAEQSWLFRVSLHLELCEPGGVSLNGLGHLPVHRVELHGSDDAVLLRSREQVRFGRDRGEFQVKHERAAKRF